MQTAFYTASGLTFVVALIFCVMDIIARYRFHRLMGRHYSGKPLGPNFLILFLFSALLYVLGVISK